MIFWDLVEVLMIFFRSWRTVCLGQECARMSWHRETGWPIFSMAGSYSADHKPLVTLKPNTLHMCWWRTVWKHSGNDVMYKNVAQDDTRMFSAGDCTRSYGGRCMWCGSYGGVGQISHMSSKSYTEHSSSKKQCEWVGHATSGKTFTHSIPGPDLWW